MTFGFVIILGRSFFSHSFGYHLYHLDVYAFILTCSRSAFTLRTFGEEEDPQQYSLCKTYGKTFEINTATSAKKGFFFMKLEKKGMCFFAFGSKWYV
jgi:hypothetical protein